MKGLHYAMQIAYSSKNTLMFTYQMGLKYKNVPGVYIECGCAAGAQIIALAEAAPDKTIYAFDSFEGIMLPSNRDDQRPGIAMLTKAERMALPDPGKQVLQSSGATVVPLEDFMNHLKESGVDYSGVIPIKGWFENTVPKFGNEIYFEPMMGINILRLDGDLYNSTYVCLQHLYPRMLSGSVVIIDDYGLEGCRSAVEDYFTNDLREPMPEMKCVDSADCSVVYWFV